jgi:hypothetical protein
MIMMMMVMMMMMMMMMIIIIIIILCGSCNGLVGVVTGLPAGSFGVRIREDARRFVLLQNVPTLCGAPKPYCSVGTGDPSPR